MTIKFNDHNNCFSTDGIIQIEVTRRRIRAYRMVNGEKVLVLEKVLTNIGKDGVVIINCPGCGAKMDGDVDLGELT